MNLKKQVMLPLIRRGMPLWVLVVLGAAGLSFGMVSGYMILTADHTLSVSEFVTIEFGTLASPSLTCASATWTGSDAPLDFGEHVIGDVFAFCVKATNTDATRTAEWGFTLDNETGNFAFVVDGPGEPDDWELLPSSYSAAKVNIEIEGGTMDGNYVLAHRIFRSVTS